MRPASLRAALWIGWCFGWAHLTLANNWIATAFTHQAKMPEFLGWLAVPLLCIYLAWYPALAALAAHMLAKKRPLWAFGLVLAGAWIITEWLRGWVFTGYPWPPLGLMLLGGWHRAGLAAVLPWMGTYAMSGLTIAAATAVLMAPVALALAAGLEASPYPFAMTVALSASAAFMTPVSSPVNTLVLGPGNYKFMDFIRVGVPFTLLVMVVSVIAIPWFFPF